MFQKLQSWWRIISSSSNKAGQQQASTKQLLACYSDDAPCKITDILYLGSAVTERDEKALESTGITHILQVAREVPSSHTDKYNYFRIDLTDDVTSDLLAQLRQGLQFIEETGNAKGKVLVHCLAGISRSASFCVAWLMTTERIGYDEALRRVRASRSWAHPNVGFEAQLRILETCAWDLDAAEAKWSEFKQSTLEDLDQFGFWSILKDSRGRDPTLPKAQIVQEVVTAQAVAA